MARNQRVSDKELETGQLKDMLDDGVDDESVEQDDEGTVDDEDSSQADDKEGRDTEASDGEQESDDGRGDKRNSDGRNRDDKHQQAGQRPNDRQKQQQTQNSGSVLEKLDEKTRNAVMSEAIGFVRQRTQPVFNKLEMENRKLKEAMTPHLLAGREAEQYGLKPHDRVVAYRMLAAFNKDPLATIKHLIVEAKKKGHNLDLTGEGGTNSVDMRAIQGMIHEAIAPMRGEFDNRREQQEAYENAREQLTNFLADNPDASPHVDLLNGILQRFPNESLETAWLKIKLHAANNGLDVNRPLRQQQQQRGNGANQDRRPMNLRGTRMAQSNQNGNDTQTEFANPNDRWDDIIRKEMRAAGINVR